MNYRRLGHSGLQVSRVCLGGNSWGAAGHRDWNAFDAATSRAFFARAIDLGINFFDTANSYNAGDSESLMGQELLSMAPRDELVIATKVGWQLSDRPNQGGLGRKHLLASVEASLRRLRTDHLDMLIIHRFDEDTPIEETLGALAECVRSGKVRYLGCSKMRPTQFARLQLTAKAEGIPFIAMQSLYNLIDRDDEADLLPFCMEERIGLTPYSPLARGMLARGTAKHSSDRSAKDSYARLYESPRSTAIVERVARQAAELGVSPSVVALNWLLSQPGVVAPVIGVSRLEQLEEAVSATELRLSPQQLAALGAARDD
jgi:aryl-alcohol dehydrogenase (NADP+)